MSTRCMIEVEGCKVKLYRHCDGYPNGKWGVLATLVPQVKKFLKLRGFWDGEYLLARIAQWQMNERVDPDEVSGFGIFTTYNHDLAYIYIVKENGTIEVWESSNGKRTKLLDTVNINTWKPEYQDED